MTPNQHEHSSQTDLSLDSRPENDDEIHLLDVLLVLARHWKMIVGIMAATFLLACLITLLMPNIYTATAKILPPQEEKSWGSSLPGVAGDLASLAGISTGRDSIDMYLGLLKSRRIAEEIIQKFDLMEKFDWETRMGAYEALKEKVRFSADQETGFITVAADDQDPEFAARLANAYVEELKKLNVQINHHSVGRERAFLEDRLAIVNRELVEAEDSLREFQENNKAINLDAQASAVIEGISRLKADIAAKEVELGVLLTSQTEQNFQVKALKEGIEQLKAQLRKLENSSEGKKLSSDIFITTADVPDIGLQFARLMRDYKVQETLFELLTKQYELAKISEAKNTSSLQILDEASIPDRKSKPRRGAIALLSTFFAGLVSMILAFIIEYFAWLRKNDQERWRELTSVFSFKGR